MVKPVDYILMQTVVLVIFCWIAGSRCEKPRTTVCTNEYEFKIFDTVKSFDDAKSYCETIGSGLTIVDTQNIRDTIYDEISSSFKDYWIGATNRENPDVWKWLNGELVVNSWWNRPVEPNNLNTERCAIIRQENGLWNNVDCKRSDSFYFICQKELPKVSYEAHTFYFHRGTEEKVNFFAALQKCKQQNSRLAEISSPELNQALESQLGLHSLYYWVGGSDLKNEGTWMWNNKTTFEYAPWKQYTWSTSEPDGGSGQNCLAIDQYEWTDQLCSYDKSYICETVEASSIEVSADVIEISSGGPHSNTCKADGYPLPTFSWTYNGMPISTDDTKSIYQGTNESGAILHISSATLLNDGIYKCSAANYVGSTRFTANASTAVKVPSHPSDLDVKENLCNSSLTISWRPNRLAANSPHRVVIRNSKGEISVSYTDNDDGPFTMRRVTENLKSWEYYNVSVFPCVSSTSCKTEYSVSNIALTAGIPSEVTNISTSAFGPTSCLTTWALPKLVSKNAITGHEVRSEWSGHEITIAEEFVEKMGGDIKTTPNRTALSGVLTSFDYTGKPNRKYSFGVQAKTCAGLSPVAWSQQSCVTKKQVPYIVPNVTIQGSVDEVGQIGMSVQIPSQENGSISCLFVIVKPGVQNMISDDQKHYTLENLKKANSSIFAEQIDDEFIAVSLATSSFRLSAGKIKVVLGNESVTECDIASTNARKKRSTNGNSTFVGRNMKLDSHKDYSVYIVSTTPTGDGVLFQKSAIQPLRETGEAEHQGNDAGMIVGVLVVCILLVLLVSGLIYRWRRQAGTAKGRERILEHDQPTPSPQPQRQEETVVYQNAVVDEVRSETDIKMKEFENTYRNLLVNDGAKFAEQFENLTHEALARKGTTEIASKPELKKKNRYKNILPFDASRVIIKNNDSGYINACFIENLTHEALARKGTTEIASKPELKKKNRTDTDNFLKYQDMGFNERNKFIASQGPLPSTVVDFWLMIVEQKSSVIVMLAKCIEAGKKKCEKYWPDHKDTAHFGPVTVSNKDEVRFCGFVRRRLAVTAKLKDQTVEMTVSQYHFLTWPDHGVPPTTSHLIRMYKEAMQTHQSQGEGTPLIVHCSAGAGRSGTFVAYDKLLNQSKKMKSADPYNCVLKMRDQRVEMVQNCDQYILVHKLLLESFLFGDTDQMSTQAMENFPDADYRMKVAAKQFENLSRVEPMKITLNSNNTKISPYHRMQVVIADMEGNSHQPTIDASFVESYDESSRLIASEPLSSANVESFWRVVLDNTVSVIVTLESKPESENKYWPVKIGASNKFGELSVKLDGGESANDFDKRTLTVKGFGRAVALTHIQLLGGSKQSCSMDGRLLIKLADELQRSLRESKSSVALIHSRGGSESTGTFCAIVNLIERLKVENRVDVFRGVKDLRDCRRGMVQTLDQYILCHQAVIDYLNSFEVYSNFR